MRPETAHQYITNSIQKILHGKVFNKKKTICAIEKLLEKYYLEMLHYDSKEEVEKQRIQDMSFNNPDSGYAILPNSYNTLGYISDRFNCGFRLYWLREMIKLNMFIGEYYDNFK